MVKKKGNKAAHDPVSALYPTALLPELEEAARRLYGLACCGSKGHWDEITRLEEDDPAFRRKFLESAHRGMWAAQEELIDHVHSKKELTPSHKVLFRGVADSMAWQLIGQQLCYARRLFKGHRQPDLHNCNFDSVVLAAEHIVRATPGSIPLISDLTSFVQVGDL